MLVQATCVKRLNTNDKINSVSNLLFELLTSLGTEIDSSRVITKGEDTFKFAHSHSDKLTFFKK